MTVNDSQSLLSLHARMTASPRAGLEERNEHRGVAEPRRPEVPHAGRELHAPGPWPRASLSLSADIHLNHSEAKPDSYTKSQISSCQDRALLVSDSERAQ